MTLEEKNQIAQIIRRETNCGLHDSLRYFNQFLDALNRRPLTMDIQWDLNIQWVEKFKIY